MKPRFWSLLATTALVSFTTFLFWPVLGFGFLNFDDPYLVHFNPALFRSLSLSLFAEPVGGLYHPMTNLSFWLDTGIFGVKASGYHATNLLLHLIATTLCFVWSLRMTQSKLSAFFLAAAFAWHPTHIESVAWIAERKDTLSALFFWAALIAHSQALETKKWLPWCLCWCLTALSLSSKPFALAMPALLLCIEWWREGFKENAMKLMARRKLLILSFSLISLIAGLFTIKAQHSVRVPQDFSLAETLFLLPKQILFYFSKTLGPMPLKIIYEAPDLAWGKILPAGLLLIGLYIWIFRRHRHHDILFGLLFFALTILPMLKFVPFGDFTAVADRYLYVSIIGLLWPIARSVQERRSWTIVPFILILAMWFQISWQRLPDWQNSETMWMSLLREDPTSKKARENLGRFYLELRQYDKALIELQQGEVESLTNKIDQASALMYLGRLPEADHKIREAESENANSPHTRLVRGEWLLYSGDYPAAQRQFQQTLQEPPAFLSEAFHVRAMTSLSFLALRQNDFDSCIQWTTQALSLSPTFIAAIYNKALCLLNSGDLNAAETNYFTALDLNPNFALALNDLGVIATQRKDLEQAKRYFERASSLEPNNPLFLKNLSAIGSEQ